MKKLIIFIFVPLTFLACTIPKDYHSRNEKLIGKWTTDEGYIKLEQDGDIKTDINELYRIIDLYWYSDAGIIYIMDKDFKAHEFYAVEYVLEEDTLTTDRRIFEKLIE